LFFFPLFKHRHKWTTTHTNKWYHPTRQECMCGASREFSYYPEEIRPVGMPWEMGRWVHSDGTESKYSSAD